MPFGQPGLLVLCSYSCILVFLYRRTRSDQGSARIFRPPLPMAAHTAIAEAGSTGAESSNATAEKMPGSVGNYGARMAFNAQPSIGQTPSADGALVHVQVEQMLGGGALDEQLKSFSGSPTPIYAKDCPEGALSVEEAEQLAADLIYVDIWTMDFLTDEEQRHYEGRELNDPPQSPPWKAIMFTTDFAKGILTSDFQFVPLTKVCFLRRRDDRLGLDDGLDDGAEDWAAIIREGCPVVKHKPRTHREGDYEEVWHGYVDDVSKTKVRVKFTIQRRDLNETTISPAYERHRMDWPDNDEYTMYAAAAPDAEWDENLLTQGIDSLPGRGLEYWSRMRLWKDPVENNYWLVPASFAEDVTGEAQNNGDVLKIEQLPIRQTPATTAPPTVSTAAVHSVPAVTIPSADVPSDAAANAVPSATAAVPSAAMPAPTVPSAAILSTAAPAAVPSAAAAFSAAAPAAAAANFAAAATAAAVPAAATHAVAIPAAAAAAVDPARPAIAEAGMTGSGGALATPNTPSTTGAQVDTCALTTIPAEAGCLTDGEAIKELSARIARKGHELKELSDAKILNGQLQACRLATETNEDFDDKICDERIEVVRLELVQLSNARKRIQLRAWKEIGSATGSAEHDAWATCALPPAAQACSFQLVTARSLASSFVAPSPPTFLSPSHVGSVPAVESTTQHSSDSTCNSSDSATLSGAEGSSISRVKTEREVELVKELAAARAALLKSNNRPIALVLCDPTSHDILPGVVREISAVTTNLGEQSHVWLLSDVDEIKVYANKIVEQELRTPEVVHVISHSNKDEGVFSGFDRGPLGIRLLSELVGPNTHVLFTCCFGVQNKGEVLAGIAGGHRAEMAGRPASIFAFKSQIRDDDAIAVTKMFYEEWIKMLDDKNPHSERTTLAQSVFARGKREKLLLWEGRGINARQTRNFVNAAWCWPPPAGTTCRGSKRTRDHSACDLDTVSLSESD